jgi:hypothetical protein
MAEDKAQELTGPDFRTGAKFDGLGENEPLLGHFDGEPVILVRQGEHIFATARRAPSAHTMADLSRRVWW